jgi:hypothetical protein
MAVLFPVAVRAMISSLNVPPPATMAGGTWNAVTVEGRSTLNLIAPLLDEELVLGDRDGARLADRGM